MKTGLAVHISATEGLVSPVTCIVSYRNSDESARGVPFESPVCVPKGEKVTLSFLHDSKIVGVAGILLGDAELPVTKWVTIGLPEIVTNLGAGTSDYPVQPRIQVTLTAIPESGLEDSSFLSTDVIPEGDENRSILRVSLERLHQKLGRDRKRYCDKVLELETKLVEARSQHEQEMWKLNIERRSAERQLRAEISHLSASAEKSNATILKESAFVSDLQHQLDSSKAKLAFETEAKLALDKKLRDLKSTYETSLTDSSDLQRNLVLKLREKDAVLQRMQVDENGKEAVIRQLKIEKFELEQEIKRLEATACKCANRPLPNIQPRSQETDSQHLNLSQQFDLLTQDWNSLTETQKRTEESVLESERKEVITVIEQLQEQVKTAKMTIVQVSDREEELKTRLLRVEIDDKIKEDLENELEEANEINSQLSIENVDLSSRLKSAETSLSSLETQLKLANFRSSELEKETKSSQETIGKLRVELHEVVARSQSSAQTNNKQLEVLKTTLSMQNEEIAGLKEEIKKGNQRFETLQEEKNRLQKSVDDLQKALQHQESKCKTLSHEADSLVEQFSIERDSFETDLFTLQESLHIREEENYELHAQISSLEREKEALDRLLAEATAKIPSPKTEGKDMIDQLLREYMLAHKIQNPFIRIAEGLYTFGNKRVSVTVKNGALIIRVGGGYMFIEEFLRIYLPAETAKAMEGSGDNTPTRLKVSLPANHYAVVRSQSVDVEHKRSFTVVCEMKTGEKEEPRPEEYPKLRNSKRHKTSAETITRLPNK